jgi:general secretion pathway protein D
MMSSSPRLAEREHRRIDIMTRRLRLAWPGIALAILLASISSPATAAAAARRGPQPPRGAAVPGRADPSPSAAAGASQPASPGPQILTGPGGEKVLAFEFFGADIDHVLRLMSEAAGVNIVKSDKVTGPLTVISPEKVSVEEAFQILNEVLAVRGFTMVRTASGNYKVVERADAMQLPLPLRVGARPEDVPAGEDLITQVIPLKSLNAMDVANEMGEMLSDFARVIPTSTNSLIVTDTAGNVQQALRIIAEMENELSGGPRVFPLYHYDVEEMADLVDTFILGRGGAAGVAARRPFERRVTPGRPTTPVRTPARVVAAGVPGAALVGPEFCYPDQRTNSLVVLATPLHQKQIEDLIAQLDRPISLRDTYLVYPVQNLRASELGALVAPLVGAQLTDATPGSLTSAQGGAATSAAGRTTSPFRATQRGLAAGGTRVGARNAAPVRTQSRGALEVEPLAGPGEGGSTGDVLRVAQAPQGMAGPPVGPGGVVQVPPQPGLPVVGPPVFIVEEPAQVAAGTEALIVADDNSNVLLISAPPEELDLIQQMLEKLDVLPPQVHVRAIIAEVGLTRDTSLGFQWSRLPLLEPYGGQFTGEFTTDFGLGPAAAAEGEEQPTALGLFGQISGADFDGVLKALTTDTNVHILATPSIFTANNAQANINVSKSIPFPRSTVEYQIGSGATSTQVDYQPVGIVVNVTPRVTQGNMVRMEVAVESNELGESIDVAGQGYPTTNQRTATATLTVKDGHTIVLGGLMRDTVRRSAYKVPLLGDIPLVGALFRSSNTKREKSELLVFLTPHVVRTPTDAAELSEREKARLPEVPRSLQPPADGSATPGTEGVGQR